MTNTRIFGYADPLAARAGGKVDFMISVEGRDEVEARLVRILHGDENPEGPGYLEEAVAIDLPKALKVKRQFTQVGSFARADDPDGKLDGLTSFTLFAHVFPTPANPWALGHRRLQGFWPWHRPRRPCCDVAGRWRGRR